MMVSLFDMLGNTMGKGENAGYQHFLLFHSIFQSVRYEGRQKSGLCGKELTRNLYGNIEWREYIMFTCKFF